MKAEENDKGVNREESDKRESRKQLTRARKEYTKETEMRKPATIPAKTR